MATLDYLFHFMQQTTLWLLGMGLLFALLSRLFPCNPGMHWWKDRRGLATDLIYWFVVPPLLALFQQSVLAACAALLFPGENLAQGYGVIAQLPLWQQALLMLVLQDIYLYWMHRFFHSNRAWRFHAIHHSPKVLDWVSTRRFHPVNLLASFYAADLLCLLAGFSPAAIIVLIPFNVLFSAFVHANLRWTLGPFKYVLAGPVFHRWHHTGVKEGGMRNFAPTFPVLDMIFGTFHMPRGKLPEAYGVADKAFPEGFWGQLWYPFKKPSLRGGQGSTKQSS